MPRFKVLLRCVAEAVCANGVRALAGLVPFGDVVYDVARDACERLREHQLEVEVRELIQEAVQASGEEVKQEAAAVVQEVAGAQPEALQLKLASYLEQVPAAIRQSLKRPADPSGRSVPVSFSVRKPEDLLQFLPVRLPRFRPGDRPSGIGDWQLEELLGVGGFGEVWKARHLYFDGIAPVALKFCLDATAKDRLLKYETSVLNQVMRQGKHPGIVPLLDACLSGEPPCLKYEFIEGGDLAGLVRDWGQAPPGRARCDEATRTIRRLAEVVGYAHRLSPPIVHRDLKPANVLVQRVAGDFTLRVTDFGIGGVAALPALRDSRQGTVSRGDLLVTALRGSHTPLYASPQQMRGEPPDPRDDVHALGVIWYQLLTGDLSSGPPTGLWADDLEEAGLGKDFIRLLGACVAARPERRPRDAADLAEKLAALLAPPAAPEPPKPAKPVAKPAPPPVPVFVPAAPPDDKLQAFLKGGSGSALSYLLDLTNKHIGDEGVKALAGCLRLANLSVLILSGNQISDEGVRALAESPHIMNLSRLVLWDNRIGDEGVKALAASPRLANLSTLDLGSNRVGDEGARALATSPYMSNLSALILVSNHIGDEGARAIAESPYLANLAELKPLDNRIGAAGVSALRDRFGKRVRIY